MVVTRILAKQCKSIAQLLQLHAQAVTNGRIVDSIALHLLHCLSRLLSPHCPSAAYSSNILSYGMALFCSINRPQAFSFNAIVRIHVQLSSPLQALKLFRRMLRQSLPPDSHSFPFVLKAASSFAQPDISLLRALHAQVIHFGYFDDLYVLNSQIHGYCVCGSIEDALILFHSSIARDVVTYNSIIDGFIKTGRLLAARHLFDVMPNRDSVSWATLISGYLQGNDLEEVIALYDMMMNENVKPENVALLSTLSSCAQLGKADKGKEIHDYIEKNGITMDSFLSTGLVDFYAKCGFIEDAVKVFEACRGKTLYTWNAMLIGLAMHGHIKLLLDYFAKMVNAGINPDGVSILAALVGCSHAGLADEGMRFFNDMEIVYGVPKEAKHYGCMADLLARAGKIKEATEIVKEMPFVDDVFAWSGLLGGCKIHGNTEIAHIAANKVMELKPEDAGVYSIMANVYVNSDKWDDALNIRKSLSEKEEVIKECAYSMILLDGKLHKFLSWDCFHPRKSDILFVVNRIRMHLFEPL